MRKKKHFEENDRVFHLSVAAGAALLVIGIIVLAVRIMHPRVDSSEGEKRLKELAKVNVQEVDARIQELEKKERQSSEDWQNRSYNEKFANCLILGDSITQGLTVYEYLDQAHVNAQKGVGVVSPEESGLSGILPQVVSASPQKLFIALGMNDTIAARADGDVFRDAYKAVLDELKEALPNTQIYVNSILPVSQAAVQSDERFACVPQFNEKLKELCESEKVGFIDNTELVKEEYYESDGRHMSNDYYPEWLDHMAEVADL